MEWRVGSQQRNQHVYGIKEEINFRIHADKQVGMARALLGGVE